jgi:hypothetical protein
MKLENWSFTRRAKTRYHAPETGSLVAQGTVTNHPRLGQGEVVTSPIDKIEGKKVITASGSEYELGQVDPAFRLFMQGLNPEWDPENPTVF